MTPAQVEEAARNRYNSINSAFFSQDEIFKVIWAGEQQLAKKALVIEAYNTSITTVNGTRSYNFPSLTIAIKRAEYDGGRMDPVSFREDDAMTGFNASTTATGTPRWYEQWGKTIFLRPIPDSAKTLGLYVYQEATLLTTASVVLSTPSEYHEMLVNWTVSQMAAKDLRFDIAQYYTGLWQEDLKDAIAWARRKKRTDMFAMVKDDSLLGNAFSGVE